MEKDTASPVVKEKFPAAVLMGHLGGMARTRSLSKRRLSELGHRAAEARWKKHRRAERQRRASRAGSVLVLLLFALLEMTLNFLSRGMAAG